MGRFSIIVTLLRKCLHVIVQSSRQPEVHSTGWLSDLKLGEATEILQEEEKNDFSHLSFFYFL